jgi:hypothetical protein
MGVPFRDFAGNGIELYSPEYVSAGSRWRPAA